MRRDYRTPGYVLGLTLAATIASCALLSACGTTSTQAKLTTGLADACDLFATDLDKLTPLKAAGKLDAKTLAAIDVAVSLASPVCAPGSVPTDFASATNLVLGEAAAIYAIYQGSNH